MGARPADGERQAMAVVPRTLGFQPHEGSEVCATVDFCCRSPSLPDAPFPLRRTQADAINIMVTKRVSWYKHFKFESR
jgi:hypothetical protein